MQSSQVHKLRNLLTLVLGGIETNNSQLARQGIRHIADELTSCEIDNNLMTAKEFVSLVKMMGVAEQVMHNDLSFVFRRLSTCLPELRTKNNMRLNDQIDFRDSLQELADEFRSC